MTVAAPPTSPPPRGDVVTLWDLDDTLYQSEELRSACASNIRQYMVERLGFTEENVHEACTELYLNYGTTLAGLVAKGHSIDFDDWHAAVHGRLPYTTFLSRDAALRQMLDSIAGPKWVFTNADQRHADVCLDILGVADCFDGIIAFENIMEAGHLAGIVHHNKPVLCKPSWQAFETALRMAGVGDAKRAVFFDDSLRNIASAHKHGIFSVLVGRTGVDCASDLQVQTILDLPSAMPWLWEASKTQQEPGLQQPLPAQHQAVSAATLP